MTTESRRTRRSRFKRLLVAYDGSEEAQHATELAIELAASLDAQLCAFVVVPERSELETDQGRELAERAAAEHLGRELERLVEAAEGEGVTLSSVYALDEDPVTAIESHVRRHGFDLLVVGNHGRERGRHGGLGRTLDQVLRDPPCPVLVASVPAAPHD